MLRIVGRGRVDRGKINPFLGAHVCAIHIHTRNIQHRIYAYPAHRDIVYCMHRRRGGQRRFECDIIIIYAQNRKRRTGKTGI